MQVRHSATTLSALLLLCSFACLNLHSAPKKTDFSGSYLNVSKVREGRVKREVTTKLTVTQSEDELNAETTVDGNTLPRKILLNGHDSFNLTSGGKTVRENAIFKGQKLVILTQLDSKGIQSTIEEAWGLSQDGKHLTIASTLRGGTLEMGYWKTVYDRVLDTEKK
jgi:hypothetical protein